MTGDPGPPSVSSLFMFGSRSVSLTSMLAVFDQSSRHARSGSGDGHHILEGVTSDAAIAQMALWISQQDSLPQGVREKARRLYVHARGRTDRAFGLLDSRGYVKPHRDGGAVRSPQLHDPLLTEGNSIQYTFMIAHDVLGLKRKIDAGERRRTALSRQSHHRSQRWFIRAYRSLLDA